MGPIPVCAMYTYIDNKIKIYIGNQFGNAFDICKILRRNYSEDCAADVSNNNNNNNINTIIRDGRDVIRFQLARRRCSGSLHQFRR